MARRPWPTVTAEHFSKRWLAVGLAWLVLLWSAPAVAEVALAPSSDGYLGAWLVAGPLPNLDTERLPSVAPRLNQPAWAGAPSFRLLADARGAIDLKSELRVGRSAGPFAVVGGELSVKRGSKAWLLLSIDGGARVYLDGKLLFDRDVKRLRAGSWDPVPVELTPGRHRLVLALHHSGEHWAFEVRLLDRADLLPPAELSLLLPGTTDADRDRLAKSLLTSRLQAGVGSSGYRPKLELDYSRGAPRHVPLPLSISVSLGGADREKPLRAGALKVGARGAQPYGARLLAIAASSDSAPLKVDFKLGPVEGRHTLDVKRPVVEALRAADGARRTLASSFKARLSDTAAYASSLDLLVSRLREAEARDVEPRRADLERFVSAVEKGDDPLLRPGVNWLGLTSPLDGLPQPVLLHVPPGVDVAAARRYPLVVVLHGYNGSPEGILQAFLDDLSHDPKPGVDGFVIAPHAYGNSFYRGPGEHEVLRVLDWAQKYLPIDTQRVSISGVSMGGTGTAHIALRYAERFSAAAPLCGYQSYFVRRDTANRPVRPWERARMAHWSPASFADNGRNLPMYLAHGTKDFPLENSKILVRAYRSLGYSMLDEWPDTGHHVWDKTYAGARMWTWLSRRSHDREPLEISLKTDALRFARQDWLSITALELPGQTGRARALIADPERLVVKTQAVLGLRIDPPKSRVAAGKPLTLEVDGQSLSFDGKSTVELHRSGKTWAKGPPSSAPHTKRAGVEGPIRDAYLGPLAFVYGAGDARTLAANRELARLFARGRWGMDIEYPLLADRELTPELEKSHSLFVVGSPTDHRLLRDLSSQLPIRVDGDALVLGRQRHTGRDLGALFIRENPRAPGRYLVVLTAPTPAGIWRALSLPQLLPDFVVYDHGLAAAAGEQILGSARVIAAGFFGNDWSLPQVSADIDAGAPSEK